MSSSATTSATASLSLSLLSSKHTRLRLNPSTSFCSFININNMVSGTIQMRMMPLSSSCALSIPRTTTRPRSISCEVAFKSSDSQTSTISAAVQVNDVSSSASQSTSSQGEIDVGAKIGARVRVKVPLKVYHVPKVPELDLTGMEGQIKQYVGLWNGKRISANLPYKLEFVTEIQGRGPVKFFAHLKEDEFEYI